LLSPSPSNQRSTFGRVAETLAIAATGGTAVGLTGIPAGWLSGSIITVAVASLAGRPLLMPTRLTQAIYVLIGISLGGVVTPQTLHGIATYPLSIAVLVVAMAFISFAGATYLRRVHGWDQNSAYLASAPGDLSQVIALGAEIGADLRAIAIVQTMRVVIIAVGLPSGLALLGLVGPSVRRVGGPFSVDLLGKLAVLVVASALAAVLAYRTRFPGGLLFGAMLTSAALHGGGWIHAVTPWWVANAAMVALGAVSGSRFANMSLALLAKYILAAFGSFAVAVLISSLFAAGLIGMLSLRAADVLIAFAPGSVDAMMLLALALNLDPVYVGAHHLARIFFVSLSMPFVLRLSKRQEKLRGAVVPPQAPFQD